MIALVGDVFPNPKDVSFSHILDPWNKVRLKIQQKRRQVHC
jgi:hypothetical protein